MITQIKFKKQCPKCGKEQHYTQRSSLYYAIRQNKICKLCKSNNEKKLIKEIYKKQCPSCDKDIIYKKRTTLSRSIKENRKCLNCARSGKNGPSWKGYGDIPATIFYSIKRGAMLRNIPFNITIKDMDKQWQKQGGKCAYTVEKLNLIAKYYNRKNITASLDRIDSSKPYEIGNIEWVHKNINMAKQRISKKEFIELCNKISEYNTFNECITPVDIFINNNKQIKDNKLCLIQ